MEVPKNRAQRHAKYERLKDETLRLLLDGLEVESIVELKRLVDIARRVRCTCQYGPLTPVWHVSVKACVLHVDSYDELSPDSHRFIGSTTDTTRGET